MGAGGVNWADFDNEHESFGWVATALEQLGASAKKERTGAFRRLEQRLVGQGGVFLSASAALMPLLLQRAADPGAHDLDRLLILATDLAVGGHHNHLAGGWGPSSPLASAAGEPEVRTAFVQGIAAVAPHLGHRKAAVRAAACLALAFVPEKAGDHLPALIERYRSDRSVPVRFGALLAAALLARGSGDAHEVRADVTAALASDDAVLRFGGSLATMWTHAAPLEVDSAISTLLEALGGRQQDRKLLWCGGRYSTLSTEPLLQAIREDGRRDLVGPLADALAGTRAEAAFNAALVAITFGPAVPDAPLKTWGDLDEGQRWLLARIAQTNPSNLERVGCTASALTGRGLMDRKPDLQRFCGLVPPGPLEQMRDDRPLWWHLMAARDDASGWDSLHERLATLSEEALLSLAEDAITGAYRLDTRWPPVKRGDRADALVLMLAAQLEVGIAPDRLVSWAREVAAGGRHGAQPKVLSSWSRAGLALLVVSRVGAYERLGSDGRLLMWTALYAGTEAVVRPALERLPSDVREELLLDPELPCRPFPFLDTIDAMRAFEWALPVVVHSYAGHVRADRAEAAIATLIRPGAQVAARLEEALQAGEHKVIRAALERLSSA